MTEKFVDPSYYINMNDDTYPEIQIGCVSNMYVRMMNFKQVGSFEPGHSHPFDHLTLLAKGAVELEVDNMLTTFVAPKMIFIAKDKVHSIKAIESDTLVFCIHPIRNGERVEDIIDPSMLPEQNYEILDHLQKNNLLQFICE